METRQNNYQKQGATLQVGVTEIGPYYWVGHCANGVDYYAGQSFTAPANGRLKRIKLFPSMVYGDTEARLSVFAFDHHTQQWKEKKAEAKAMVSKNMEGQWIAFTLPDIETRQGEGYAFKLSCNHGGMLAIAECPWTTFNAYAGGRQWIGSSQQKEGTFHNDFDLAFVAEFEALQ